MSSLSEFESTFVYEPKYTTVQSIQRKLRSRLKITDGGLSIYNQDMISNIAVDEDLVRDLIEEHESFLDGYLRQVYVLPLKHRHPILRKCIDGLVIADLLETHSFSGGETSDSSGYGSKNRMASLQIIRALTYDLNVVIPGLPDNRAEFQRTQTLILDGEELRSTVPDQPVSFSTFNVIEFDKNIAQKQGIFFGLEEEQNKWHL